MQVLALLLVLFALLFFVARAQRYKGYWFTGRRSLGVDRLLAEENQDAGSLHPSPSRDWEGVGTVTPREKCSRRLFALLSVIARALGTRSVPLTARDSACLSHWVSHTHWGVGGSRY